MEHPERLVLPFLAAIAGVACLSLMDALMKEASLAAGVFTASFLRSLLAAGIAVPLWLAQKPRWPRGPVMKLHVERGVISAFMALSFFYALTKLPIAEAIAISFVAPLVALYFAHLLLGEQISRGAIGASLLGFAGTLVIVWGRLGRSDFGEDTALGLASLAFSALLYAYNFVIIRKQSQLAGPLEVAVFHSGISATVHLLAVPFLFVMPQVETFGTVAGAAVLSVGASMTIAWAYARAEAQVLVPVEYSGFLWAALFGWLFFRETVTVPTMVGVVIIVVACWIAAPRAKRAATTEAANL
ncbi:DMT family transporter [Aurantiacibacter sp. MUD11]|uniref:DMT family transporter n=1 Tax=Aurantiacibacter sp. MUD11 TaxID=3003265 RepID=UPI0022AA1F08|nr:DMT family transporter [Aurantiacibacter sp. MUD11]WAT16746.1 DMT family transporter [Aurantiacibacter sp. MUD11]